MSAGALGPTYRVQLGPSNGFRQVAGWAGYLADLGIELVYLSPVTEAVPGSAHGYDGTDPTMIRDELGGRDGFDNLVDALHHHGLGVLLDIVPNHLSTWPHGPWWGEVLRLGQESASAPVFDIDWDAGGGKVTLPLLGAPLSDVLAAGELQLAGGALWYHDTALPLAPGSADGRAPGDTRSDEISDVLSAQHYRLAEWRDQRARNYRRFFDIDGLVGVRQEDPSVFERTHRLIAELAARGAVQALRVDHVDGLADPAEYLGRLRELAGVPVVVEKILTGDETLPASWPVVGTTGYESLDDLSGALVDPAGMDRLVRRARRAGERTVDEVVVESKRLVASEVFPAEVERAAELLALPPEQVAEAAVAMPVYRTYLGRGGVSSSDRDLIESSLPPEVGAALLEMPAHLEGVVRFQQLTGPVMAKGVEDTAWYRLVGPLPFLEVGGDPRPGRWHDDGARRMHERATARSVRGERGLVPGTTHDTKRSADVRARLLALAEVPFEFEAGLVRLAELAPSTPVKGGPPVPDARERRLVAATLLATAPLGDGAFGELAERIGAALTKMAREAKLRSSWTDPELGYERALVGFARRLLADEGALLHAAFGGLLDEVAVLGATLSLAGVVLRSVVPGVPDCYQGDESWDFSLVDPDNRRAVDVGALASRLASVREVVHGPEDVASLSALWRDGRVKLHVTSACLAARRRIPEAFGDAGMYASVDVHGSQATSALALARIGPAASPRLSQAAEGVTEAAGGAQAPGGAKERVGGGEGSAVAVAVVTRFPRRLASAPDQMPVSRRSWGDTWMAMPPELGDRPVVDALTGLRHQPLSDGAPGSARLELGAVLADLPVALLVTD